MFLRILQISLSPTLVTYFNNIMGDKLLINFGAKFRVNNYIISHVKLQSCHGNVPITCQCQDGG